MSIIAFTVCILLLLWAGYAVVRTRLRRYTCCEMVSHMKPLSDHARQVIAQNTQGHVPETWLEFADLYRAAHNLTWWTMLADRFQRSIASCTDDYAAANMRLTHNAFIRRRYLLLHGLLIGFVYLCCGSVAKRNKLTHMATVLRHYTDDLLLVHEMAELMDRHCMASLEGQFLHGS